MAASSKRVPKKSGNGATLIAAVAILLVFLDAAAITWYLWKLPDSSLTQLGKVLRAAGGWVVSAVSFFGIRHSLTKAAGWQVASNLIVASVTALVWFLLLPVHSLQLQVRGEGALPLANATASIAGESQPRGASSGADGSLVVGSLAAASYDVIVAHKGYVSQRRIYPFLDIVWPGTFVPLSLEREVRVFTLVSKPQGAAISLDGESRGLTPADTSLPTGPHQVVLTLGGCPPVKFDIEVYPGGPNKAERDLVCAHVAIPTPYALFVDTRQAEVAVSIDGVNKGIGPLNTKLSAGEHTVTASFEGKKLTKTVRIPEQSVVTFDMGRQQ